MTTDTGNTHYTLTTKGDVRVQRFQDGKAAAEAFYDTDPAKRPLMVMTDGNGAAIVGTSIRSRERASHQIPQPENTRAKEFREAYLSISELRPPRYTEQSKAAREIGHVERDRNERGA